MQINVAPVDISVSRFYSKKITDGYKVCFYFSILMVLLLSVSLFRPLLV